MGLMDKKISDFTPRDVVNVWSLGWIWDLVQILLVVPLLFKRSRPKISDQERAEAMKEYRRQLEITSLEKTHLS